MSFWEYVWSFSFENKYLGHLYGITEISFIVTVTVVLCWPIFQCSLWSAIVNQQRESYRLQCSIPTLQPGASIYKSVWYPLHSENSKETQNYQDRNREADSMNIRNSLTLGHTTLTDWSFFNTGKWTWYCQYNIFFFLLNTVPYKAIQLR